MLKQTRFYLGLMLAIESVSCLFLGICYLFKGKRETAGPLTLLGIISGAAGAFMLADKVREYLENEEIIEAMNDICDSDYEKPDIPVDETADEAEFN